MSAVEAHSYERYNGGVKIKRLYGSSTVTRFYVFRKEDANDASKWKKVEGFGKTPGERKTDAIRRSGLLDAGARRRRRRLPPRNTRGRFTRKR